MLNRMFISRKSPLYLSLIGLIGGCVSGNEKLQFFRFRMGGLSMRKWNLGLLPKKLMLLQTFFVFAK